VEIAGGTRNERTPRKEIRSSEGIEPVTKEGKPVNTNRGPRGGVWGIDTGGTPVLKRAGQGAARRDGERRKMKRRELTTKRKKRHL